MGSAASRKKPGVFNLFTTKSVVISAFIFAFQQFAGINAIIYFSSSVFAQASSEPRIGEDRKLPRCAANIEPF